MHSFKNMLGPSFSFLVYVLVCNLSEASGARPGNQSVALTSQHPAINKTGLGTTPINEINES